jgi:hypothetical protein
MIKAVLKRNAIFSFDPKGSHERIAFLFLVILLSFSNLEAKEKLFNYLKNGVSFSIPIDWKTISDEALPDKGYYYSAESTGKRTTGLFTLVTINKEENPVKSLLIQERNMKDEEIYKDAGIEFTEIANGKFGSMDAKVVEYESVVKGTKVSGTIYCFNCSEKTYLLFFQTGLDDKDKNAKIFRMIELTFACR